MDGMTTFNSLLEFRGRQHGEETAHRVLGDGGECAARRTYAQLDRLARVPAGRLNSKVAGEDRVLLFYPPGLNYASAFVACTYAGVMAVSAHPGTAPDDILEPLHGGFPAILIPPFAFFQRLVWWLTAVSERRATVSAAPDFRHEPCIRLEDLVAMAGRIVCPQNVGQAAEGSREECDIDLDELVLIAPRTIPKTSGGKIKRAATRAGISHPVTGSKRCLQACGQGSLASHVSVSAMISFLSAGNPCWTLGSMPDQLRGLR